MIAADTSALIDYFQGVDNPETEKVDEALNYHALVLPPVVLTEVLSDPLLSKIFIEKIERLTILETTPLFWQRAAHNRAKLLAKKLKARLADTLIAQSCIDYQIPLIARDSDFRHFVKHCGLVLL